MQGRDWTMSIIFYLVVAFLAAFAVLVLYFVNATGRLAREAERQVPATGQFVEVDGNRIHYREYGSGRPILFIHGLGGQMLHFPPPLLDALKGDFRLIVLDRPGSGYSTRKDIDNGRLPQQADDIAGLIDTLKLEKPLLVGHSLGGMIALTVALNHPVKISGLALLSPLTHGVGEAPQFAGLKIPSRTLRRIISQTIAVPLSARSADATMGFIFAPQKTPADYMVAGGGWLGLRPSHFYATSTDFTAVELDIDKLSPRYGEIRLPVGILAGDRDQVLDTSQQTLPMRDAIAGVDIEILPGVGHMPQFVEPGKTAAFIRRMAARAFGG